MVVSPVVLAAKVAVLLDDLIPAGEGALAAQLGVHLLPLAPDAQLYGLVAGVAEPEVDVVVADRGPGAERNVHTFVGGQRVGMVVELGHLQRAVQHQLVQRVRKVAQPAADVGRQAVVCDDAPLFIAVAAGDFAHRLPKGEYLPRADQQPVDLAGRQADVDRLVLLVFQVDARRAADHVDGARIHQVGQRLALVGAGKGLRVQPVSQVAAQNFFLYRDRIEQRVHLAKQFTAFLRHGGLLSRQGDGTDATAPAAVAPAAQQQGFHRAALAEMALVGMVQKLHQDAVQPGAVGAVDIGKDLVAHHHGLLGPQAQHLHGAAVGGGVRLVGQGDVGRIVDVGQKPQDAFLAVVGEQQRFQPGAVDARKQRVHRRGRVVAVRHQRVVDVKQHAAVAQAVQRVVVDGKYAGGVFTGVKHPQHRRPPVWGAGTGPRGGSARQTRARISRQKRRCRW